MTLKKKTPAKRGRKPKEGEAKLEQLTIRLSPKLKFGLDLLARAQGRSLSQAVEWSLLVGLNNYRADDNQSIADLLEAVWTLPNETSRYIAIWCVAPALLPFELRAACDLVHSSREWRLATQSVDATTIRRAKKLFGRKDPHQDVKIQRYKQNILYDFVHRHFDQISETAATRGSAGRPLANLSLIEITKVEDGGGGRDPFAVMAANTEQSDGNSDSDSIYRRIKEWESKYIWTSAFGGKK